MPKDHPQAMNPETPSSGDPKNGQTSGEASRARDGNSLSPGSEAAEHRNIPVDTGRLSVVADICRRAAADLARQGYKPDGEKVLRRFGLNEISRYMIPLPAAELRALLRNTQDLPQGHMAGGQPFFSLEEVNTIRAHLHAAGTVPADRPRAGQRAAGSANSPQAGQRPVGQARIVTVCNFKGGVSKTTTAAHLAMAAALDGLNVLVVDLDSQASMSALFGVTAEDERQTAYALMAWDRARAMSRDQPQDSTEPDPWLDLTADDLIRPTHWPTVDILPAQLNLYWAEFQVPVWLQESPGWAFWDALKNFLAEERLLDDYDLVVIDTPPALGYLTINALAAADIVLVPVGASYIEFDSTGRFFDMLHTTFASIEETLAGAGGPRFAWDAVQVLLTRYDAAQQADMAGVIEAYLGDVVAAERLAFTALVGQAGERVSGVYEAAPSDFNAQTYRRGRASFDQAWAGVRALIERCWADPGNAAPGPLSSRPCPENAGTSHPPSSSRAIGQET